MMSLEEDKPEDVTVATKDVVFWPDTQYIFKGK